MNFLTTLFLKAFNQPGWKMMRRVFLRSVILGFLLILAGELLNFLIDFARLSGSDFPDRFPEVLIIFRAVAILTWFEMSIFWIRMATAPRIDIQDVAKEANQDPMAAAMLYCAKTLTWVVRLVVLMQLCNFWK